MVYQAVMHSIVLCVDCAWHVWVADKEMLLVIENDRVRWILRVRRGDCVPTVELRRHLYHTSISAQLVQR